MFSKFLCFIGIHKWDTATSTHGQRWYSYQRCKRTPSCRRATWECGDIKEIPNGRTD